MSDTDRGVVVKLYSLVELTLPPFAELVSVLDVERASERPHAREDEEALDLCVTQVRVLVHEGLKEDG